MQVAVKSSHFLFACGTEPLRRFSAALRLVEKIIDEAESIDSATARGALDFTYFDTAVLSSAEEYDILLYIEDAAANTRDRKHIPPFFRHAFCCYAAYPSAKAQILHRFACEKRPSAFEKFLLTKTAQAESSSLPVKKEKSRYKKSLLARSCQQERISSRPRQRTRSARCIIINEALRFGNRTGQSGAGCGKKLHSFCFG